MSVEGVISPDYEGQALMILTARSCRPMLNKGRNFSDTFATLWNWLNERHAKRPGKLTSVHYSKLIAIKIASVEGVEDYVAHAERL